MSRDDAMELWPYRHEYVRLREKYERKQPMTRDERESLGELTTQLDAWLADVSAMRASQPEPLDDYEDERGALQPQHQRVLNAIRRLGMTNFAGVAEAMGLTFVTASNYVRYLIRKGYVEKVPGNTMFVRVVTREEVCA